MGSAEGIPVAGGFLEQLELAERREDLQSVAEALRDRFKVDHLVYHWVSANGDQYGCGTYDPVWVQRYLEKSYLRIDPVIQGCFQRFHPVDWKRLDWSSKAARAFQADAIAHGVGNQGYSIPIRGPNGQFALFTVNHSCDDDAWAEFTALNRRDMILIAHYFNQKALELEPGRRPEPAQPLSPREIEAMTLLAVGYSRAQVAETLSISEHTLRVYIESARFKLGAMNTTHAVARALSRGLIVV
ncbi:helix-turn-helix transcriptional regulator [Salipiger thiooxidans]|uniref:helix-turn-helix transcriptional regulator n=1 Tax=Salipiger thiooxidans TaxID=282683 RepID=UPI00384BAB9B